MTKYCKGCSLEKSASDFNKKTESPDSLAARCRHCVSAYNKELYKKNREKVLLHRASRKLEIATVERAYLHTERGRLKAVTKSAAYRARKKEAYIEHIDFSMILECYAACLYCGDTRSLSLEHVIPLSRGGLHALDNVSVACKPCNSSKGARLLSELPMDWFEKRGCQELVQE